MMLGKLVRHPSFENLALVIAESPTKVEITNNNEPRPKWVLKSEVTVEEPDHK